MMKSLFILIIFHSISCKQADQSEKYLKEALSIEQEPKEQLGVDTQKGQTILARISPPVGFTRTVAEDQSFHQYLRMLPLKPRGSEVKYYDGKTKVNSGVYIDVVDLDIGKKNLHQCADAVMRLRAEYLWKVGKYDDIHFNLTNGFRVDYNKWAEGYRVMVDDNKTWWEKKSKPSLTYQDFWDYLELVFMYAGTASLEKELIEKEISQAKIGDVLIQGGYPGHAVIIVDKAVHETTNQPIYLLAQSYMPAQELHILNNPTDGILSPWYKLQDAKIKTPEWTFNSGDLKSFVK